MQLSQAHSPHILITVPQIFSPHVRLHSSWQDEFWYPACDGSAQHFQDLKSIHPCMPICMPTSTPTPLPSCCLHTHLPAHIHTLPHLVMHTCMPQAHSHTFHACMLICPATTFPHLSPS